MASSTDQGTGTWPPGWYADPHDPTMERYYNGRSWENGEVRPAPDSTVWELNRGANYAAAQAALTAGERYVQIEIMQSRLHGRVAAFGAAAHSLRAVNPGVGRQIADIEDLGWQIAHVDHVYVEYAQGSRDKLIGKGQQIAGEGAVIGIYLFKR